MQRRDLWISVLLIAACSGGTTAPHGAATTAPTRTQPNTVELVGRFANATGLSAGTRVTVAGLDVGRIMGLEPEPGGTLVWFELRGEIDVWSDATLTKRSSSTLGEVYLELDRGTAAAPLGPRCPGYGSSVREDALRCQEVTTVFESGMSEDLGPETDQIVRPGQ